MGAKTILMKLPLVRQYIIIVNWKKSPIPCQVYHFPHPFHPFISHLANTQARDPRRTVHFNGNIWHIMGQHEGTAFRGT